MQMNVIESNKYQIMKGKNGGNAPRLEIAEVILVNCNIVSND